MEPHRFHKIIISGGAGLIGNDSFPQLAARFTANIAQGGLRVIKGKQADSLKQSAVSTAHYITENVPLAFKEALEISKSDIIPLLKYLHDTGVEVNVLHGEDDAAFPYERVKERLSSLAPEIKLYVSKGDHHSLFADTYEVDTALKILSDE
jgi:hypothetical protein